MSAISRIDPTLKFPKGKRTLVFFDEIQAFPDIATSLKFFAQDGQYDVICSGSLLGVKYREITSVSVGFKEDKDMFSLDFEEFLWARGYGADLSDELLDCMIRHAPLKESTQFAVKGLFLDYCTLGGMPQVVRDYVERRSFEGSLASQRRIVGDYREDIRKYADGLDKVRIEKVFDRIPAQLACETTLKFQISKVATVRGRGNMHPASTGWRMLAWRTSALVFMRLISRWLGTSTRADIGSSWPTRGFCWV